MIIIFDLFGRFQASNGQGIMDWGGGLGSPEPPPSGGVMEYIYFCRHRLRR